MTFIKLVCKDFNPRLYMCLSGEVSIYMYVALQLILHDHFLFKYYYF